MQSTGNGNVECVKKMSESSVEEGIEAAAGSILEANDMDDVALTGEVRDSDANAIEMPSEMMSQVPMALTGATEPLRPPSSVASVSDKDDEDVLGLQVLSARSSTPYTVQAICCANANCDLVATDSTTVTPVKEVEIESNKNETEQEDCQQDKKVENKKYSRLDLIQIRDEMANVIKPECLARAQFKRLNLGRNENGSENVSNSKNKNYRSSNATTNDLMPAFFKRKSANSNSAANSITYDNFRSTHPEPGPPNINHRRIGSGRLSNRDMNWAYGMEGDQEDLNNNSKLPQRQMKKYGLDDNSNYVKRVISSVVSESSARSIAPKSLNNSSNEERCSNNASINSAVNTKNDEPEWFSCGPTSRLDTIELCGFDESDQQKIRLEMENVKKKIDANNNQEPLINGNHSEKKQLPFHFDDFSNHNGKTTHNNFGGRMLSSKFMPLFSTKNREESKGVNQTLNEFLKRTDMAPIPRERLSLTEIPSVDEIEAKWRGPYQQDEVNKSRPPVENVRNSADSFKKMLTQLNQQQQQQPATVQPIINLFNNENISHFIKQRNLQQLLQKQQQQAAFAQLQLNAILSRPEAQMLLMSLARGEISKQGLLVQLANPNLTQADREAISAVLTFSSPVQYHQQLAINSNHQQQQQFIANQLQNLAVLQQMNKNTSTMRNLSVIGNCGGGGINEKANVRTYSQEELQSHANYILHNAMMKKKIEEQANLGLQKILHLQNTVLSNNNSTPKAQQRQQPQQLQKPHQQPQQHQRKKLNAASRGGSRVGRRRSTSSSSSNATVKAVQMKLATNLEIRQQEQRRNTIATATVGGDLKSTTPGVLALAMAATLGLGLSYQLLKPELEGRRRRQAEAYANIIFEKEQQRRESSAGKNSNTGH